jgi:hypothetical protein
VNLSSNHHPRLDEEDAELIISKPSVEDEENFNRRWTRMDADEEDRKPRIPEPAVSKMKRISTADGRGWTQMKRMGNPGYLSPM